MKRALVLLLFVLPLLAQAQRPAMAGKFRIAGIHAKGSTHFPEADIVAATGLKIGESIAPERLKTVADTLATTGAFEQVSYKFGPAGTGMAVQFLLTDAPELIPADFDNFVWFTRQQLMDAVRARVPLFHGEVPSQGEMTSQITEALQGLLASRGIPGQVGFHMREAQTGPSGSGGAFSVEGVEIQIRSVTFPGADPADLPALEAASKGLLKIPWQRSVIANYTEQKLRPVYLAKGYLKVSFGEPTATLVSENPAEPTVSLSIPITPGLQYRLGAIRWTGNKLFPSLDLQKEIKLKVGDPANLVELQRDLDAVHNLYAAKGYLRQTTSEIQSLDDSVHVVSYELRVAEGDQYRFASLELTGVEPKVRDLVREQWTLREGEPYDPGYIKTFLDAAIPLMRKGAVTQVQQDINDQERTVAVGIQFEFQEPIIVPPASPGAKPAGRKPSR
jgi:outer membrane protein insertion porin family